MGKNKNKIKLIIMIVTTVFSFTSMSDAFFLKGYSAIPWFLLSALTYFVPYLFIVSDLTSVYNDRNGGIYTWLKDSTSQRLAFVATLLWYSSYFIWMISLFMKTWIPLSILLFGKDITQESVLFGNIPTMAVIAVLSIVLVFLISLVILGGFQKILDISFFSGRCLLFLVSLMGIGSLFCLTGHHGDMATSLQVNPLFSSQGKFQTPTENLSFFIFGITAFGGLDTVACLVNNTGELKKKFSKLVVACGGAIITLYIAGIVLWGASIDLSRFVDGDQFHLGNLMYGLMGQLALNVAEVGGFSQGMTILLLQVFLRLTALTLFTAYLSLLSIISFGPLQAITQGLKETRLKASLQRVNRKGITILPVIIQGIGLGVFILLISLSQKTISGFYNQLTLMTNISRSIPYLLVALSYPAFKRLYPTNRELSFVNPKRNVYLFSISVSLSVALSIFFSVYEKIAVHEFLNASLLLFGPVVFALLGAWFFKFCEEKPAYHHGKM